MATSEELRRRLEHLTTCRLSLLTSKDCMMRQILATTTNKYVDAGVVIGIGVLISNVEMELEKCKLALSISHQIEEGVHNEQNIQNKDN